MAKTSRRRVARYEKDHSGCMRGLINIFDFRHVRPSHKLISDRKHGSRRIIGAAYPKNKIQIVEDLGETYEDILVTEHDGTDATDTSKMSVKELMAEEMCGDQDQKKQTGCAEGDPKQSADGPSSDDGKNRRRTSKMSFDLDELHAAEYMDTERPILQKHKSLSSLDLNVMMEELYSQIDEKKINFPKHEQDKELSDSSVVDDMLGEAAKVFVDHFMDGKNFPQDRKIQPSRELLDALQVLNSNKEVFMKLLQDPNSQLVKNLQEFQDSRAEKNENSEILGDSGLLQQDIGHGKQQSFWRKLKGLERGSSKKTENIHELSKIVVLKPGPTGAQNLENATSCSLLLQPRQQDENNSQTERSSSYFSFSEFRKKWRFGARKEQFGIAPEGTCHPLTSEQPSSRNGHNKTSCGENSGLASHSRDHFFIERIPKACYGIKRGNKVGSPRDSISQLGNENEGRASNIYVEARKHLAEIVGNGEVDIDFLSRQVPRSLGRILSFPDYNSPICSPRKSGENSFLAAEIRLSPRHKCDMRFEQQMQETGLPGPVGQGTESQLCMPAEKPDDEVAVPNSDTGTSEELSSEHDVDKTLTLARDEKDAEGGMEIVTHNEEAIVPKESTCMEIPVEPCVVSSTIVQVDDAPKVQEREECSTNMELETFEQKESSCSPTASPPKTKKPEELNDTDDRVGQPSPISVLEPSFADDISPPGIRSLSGIEPPQPRQIQFEEQASPPLHASLHRTATEGNKNYTFEFVKGIVKTSGLTWDELFKRSLFSDHIIDPSLFDELDFLPDHLSMDPRLLFDLVDEIISEFCWFNYGCIISFTKSYVRPELKGKDVVSEIWEGADWYLQMQGPIRTLELVVAKDFAKPGSWMDLRFDIEDIDVEMEEVILQELVEDTISCCINLWQNESRLPVPSAESEGDASDTNLLAVNTSELLGSSSEELSTITDNRDK